VQRLKAKVAELLVRSNTDPWPEVRDDLNRSLRGWSNYFNLGSPVVAFRSVDHYVRVHSSPDGTRWQGAAISGSLTMSYIMTEG
jgi:hypothetical protein